MGGALIARTLGAKLKKSKLKIIVGAFEFLIGISFPIIALAFIITGNSKYTFKWQYIFTIPIYIGFIEYGWKWMRSIINISDKKILSEYDNVLLEASKNAQTDIIIFESFLEKGIYECYILASVESDTNEYEDIWCVAHFKRENYFNISLIINEESNITDANIRRNIDAGSVKDWKVIMIDEILGMYRHKAICQAIINDSFRLDRKSKRVFEKLSRT